MSPVMSSPGRLWEVALEFRDRICSESCSAHSVPGEDEPGVWTPSDEVESVSGLLRERSKLPRESRAMCSVSMEGRGVSADIVTVYSTQYDGLAERRSKVHVELDQVLKRGRITKLKEQKLQNASSTDAVQTGDHYIGCLSFA